MPWPDGTKALRQLGMTRPQLGMHWVRAQHDQGSIAVLDRRITSALVPFELWPVLATLVLEGPGIVVERMERHLLELCSRIVRPTRARPPGATYSKRSATSFATTLRRLMGILCDLNRRGAVHPSLEQWVASPRVKVPRAAVDANTDRSAPPLYRIRHDLRMLDSAFRERFAVGPGDDELSAIAAVPAHTLFARGAWRLGRNRALFTVLCVTGSRKSAVLRLMASDFDARHADPDGKIGPGIALRPGKTLDTTDVRWKPLPVGAARWIEAHLLLTRRLVLETDNRWRSRRERLPDDYPLFPVSLKHLETPFNDLYYAAWQLVRGYLA